MQAITSTLLNNAKAMGGDFEVPTEDLARIRIPVLVARGSKAAKEMVSGQEKIAASVPGSEHVVLDKQTHNVAPSALRPELIRFFKE